MTNLALLLLALSICTSLKRLRSIYTWKDGKGLTEDKVEREKGT